MRHTRWGAQIAAALLLLGGLIAASSGAREQDRPVPPPLAQTQAGMNQQAYRDFVAADQAMNRAYKRLLAQLDKSRQAKLKTAQRTWLAFRDAHADFAASGFAGGSMQPMVYSGARAQTTMARTKQLQASLDELTRH